MTLGDFSLNILNYSNDRKITTQFVDDLYTNSFRISRSSFFKAQASSSSNFASFFIVMAHNSSALFWLKNNILSTKVAHQSENFQGGENGLHSAALRQKIAKFAVSGLQTYQFCRSNFPQPLQGFYGNKYQKDPEKSWQYQGGIHFLNPDFRRF